MKIVIEAEKNKHKENQSLIHHLIRLAVTNHNAEVLIKGE